MVGRIQIYNPEKLFDDHEVNNTDKQKKQLVISHVPCGTLCTYVVMYLNNVS